MKGKDKFTWGHFWGYTGFAAVMVGIVWATVSLATRGEVEVPPVESPDSTPPDAAPAPTANGQDSGGNAAPTTEPGTPPVNQPPGTNPDAANGGTPANNEPPPKETLGETAERLDGIADKQEEEAETAKKNVADAKAAVEKALTPEAKVAAEKEVERLEGIEKKEAGEAKIARQNAMDAKTAFEKEEAAKELKAKQDAEAAKVKAIDAKTLPEAKPDLSTALEGAPVIETVTDGQGLVAVTRDALEGMAQAGTLTPEMIAGIKDPYLKAVFQAAFDKNHDQLTSALTELYKQGGHYIPGAATGESTLLHPGDKLVIDKDGIHLVRAGSGEVLPIANADGLVARPEGTKMTPPVHPVTAEVPAETAPVDTAHSNSTTPVETKSITPSDPKALDQKQTEPDVNKKPVWTNNHSEVDQIIDTATTFGPTGKKT